MMGISHVWRPKKSAYNPLTTSKFGGGNVLALGCKAVRPGMALDKSM